MTKKEEEKKLVWKMKELPTADSIGKLVDTKVITPEEARSILFKEETKQSEEVEALKTMVETLKEMVEDLLSRQDRVTFVPYTKVIEVPKRVKPYWEEYWLDSGSLGTSYINTTASTTNGTTTYTMSIK